MSKSDPGDLRQWLRQHSDPGATLLLSREAVAALAEELGQTRQSADRLRKQNAKLRKRIDRLRAGQPDPGGDDPGDPETEPQEAPPTEP